MAMRVLARALCFLQALCLCSSLNMEIEVHLDRLNNTIGKLADGTCCNGVSRTDGGNCIGECNMFARVCLTVHKDADLQLNSRICNIAYNITGLVGHSYINEQAADVRFPDPPNTWKPNKGPFRVIVQLFHSPTSTDFSLANAHLIANGSTYEMNYMPSLNWTSHRSWRADNVEFVYSYRIRCAANHYGGSCQRLCVPRDDIVGHFSCDSQGRRVCLPGYSGALCRKPVCDRNCSSNGICEGPNICTCLPGWTGSNCSQCIPMPHCSPKHGFCRKPMECECKTGFGGMLCDIDLKWCRNNPNPCENGGWCVNKDGLGYNYTCQCPPGFTGFHCEKRSSDCRVTGCANGGVCLLNSTGTPVSLPSNALTTAGDNADTWCKCPPGFTGRQCQFNITRCSEGPCLGRGRCRDLPARVGGGFVCDCMPGWSGQNCEINTDDCKPGYCLNGGQCVDEINKFRCICRHHFRGTRCNVSLLDCRVRCLNGGVCLDRANGLECRCLPGFGGAHCERTTADNRRFGNRNDTKNNLSVGGVVEVAAAGGTKSGAAETALLAACGVLLPVTMLLLCLLTASCRRYCRNSQSRQRSGPMPASATATSMTPLSSSSCNKAKHDDEEMSEAGGGEPAASSLSMSLNNDRNLLGEGKEKLGYFAHKMVNNLDTGRSRASVAAPAPPANFAAPPCSPRTLQKQQRQQLLPSPPLATVSGRLAINAGCDVSDRQMLLRSTSLPTPPPPPPPRQHPPHRALQYQESCPFDVVAYTEV